jgi:hypothetical protein
MTVVRSIEAAAGRAGQSFEEFLCKAHGRLRAANGQVRKYRLFAKSKTEATKDLMEHSRFKRHFAFTESYLQNRR